MAQTPGSFGGRVNPGAVRRQKLLNFWKAAVDDRPVNVVDGLGSYCGEGGGDSLHASLVAADAFAWVSGGGSSPNKQEQVDGYVAAEGIKWRLTRWMLVDDGWPRDKQEGGQDFQEVCDFGGKCMTQNWQRGRKRWVAFDAFTF